MILIKLFWVFFKIGLFSIGGGYAAIPLIRDQVVNSMGWLSFNEFMDLITISQMTPGPIAINSATFIGLRTAGLTGAIVATLGCIIPACTITFILALLYKKYKEINIVDSILSGLRPVTVSLIGSAGFSMLTLSFFGLSEIPQHIKHVDFIAILIFVLSLLGLKKLNPIYVMIGAGALGGILYYIF